MNSRVRAGWPVSGSGSIRSAALARSQAGAGSTVQGMSGHGASLGTRILISNIAIDGSSRAAMSEAAYAAAFVVCSAVPIPSMCLDHAGMTDLGDCLAMVAGAAIFGGLLARSQRSARDESGRPTVYRPDSPYRSGLVRMRQPDQSPFRADRSRSPETMQRDGSAGRSIANGIRPGCGRHPLVDAACELLKGPALCPSLC